MSFINSFAACRNPFGRSDTFKLPRLPLKLVLLIALVMPTGCDQAKSETSFAQLLAQAESHRFDPPLNGELNLQQVKMYLAIKRLQDQWVKAQANHSALDHGQVVDVDLQAKATTTVAASSIQNLSSKTVGKMLAGLGLDLQAAIALGYNTAEYAWVAAKLRTAMNLGPLMIGDDRDNVAALMDVRDTLRFKRQQTEDRKLKADYKAALQFVELQLKRADERRNRLFSEYPGIAHNFNLYRQFATELESLH